MWFSSLRILNLPAKDLSDTSGTNWNLTTFHTCLDGLLELSKIKCQNNLIYFLFTLVFNCFLFNFECQIELMSITYDAFYHQTYVQINYNTIRVFSSLNLHCLIEIFWFSYFIHFSQQLKCQLSSFSVVLLSVCLL